MLFAVLNGYLFYEVDISESNMIKSYIGVILVSIVFQFFVIDLIICLFSSYYLRKTELKKLS